MPATAKALAMRVSFFLGAEGNNDSRDRATRETEDGSGCGAWMRSSFRIQAPDATSTVFTADSAALRPQSRS